MSPTDNSSLSSINNAPGVANRTTDIDIVVARVREAGLDEYRFIQLQDGSKQPISHTQLKAGGVGGNYGVYAGDGLVLVDIDDYKDTVDSGPTGLPSTFTVQSPHGGEHRYYATNPNAVQLIKSSHGSRNPSPGWGEIRVHNQYVVGPGSELSSCTKEWHDCSARDRGKYEILQNIPIQAIGVNDLLATVGRTKSPNSVNCGASSNKVEYRESGNIDAEFNVDQRLEKMMQSKKGEKIQLLWEGKYKGAGFGDRSRAEASLVSYLGWWMQGNQKLVDSLMCRACREHPRADVNGKRKWLTANKIYRDLTLEFAKHGYYYQPPSPQLPYEERPAVSSITRNNFYEALLDLRIASTAEIAEHEAFDRSESAVRRARDWYEERDLVTRITDHPRTYYYLTGLESLIDPEMRDQLGITID